MPISRKTVEEIENEKSKIRKFLEERKNDGEPYYNAVEIAKKLILRHFDVDDIEKYLFDLSSDSLIEKLEYRGVCSYKHF
ncbi:hypothetical protein KAI56_00195 [Candidatus Parcubacteria bacterium]|nr:hypothetical protein [Candidatus Parcubacteria bacterium]